MRSVRMAACLWVLAASVTAPASAQLPGEGPAAPPAAEGPAPAIPPPAGQIFGPPAYRDFLGPFGEIFGPPATRSPFHIAPSLSIRQEYDDNIFIDNRNRRSDFITSFTPGITVALLRPSYRLTAGYNVSAEIFARSSELNNVGDRQGFFLDGSWTATPRTTLSLTDRFTRSQNTARAADVAVATGRSLFWSNTLSPGLTYALTPLTTLSVVASYTIRREERDVGDEDTYSAGASVRRVLTPRLTGSVGYQVTRFEFDRGDPVTTHVPTVGASYRVTPTLTASGNVGATVQTGRGDTNVTPAISAGVAQQFAFGSAGLNYSRFVGSPGTIGQTTENQSFGASLVVTTLRRGLSLALVPRYSIVEGDTFETRTIAADLSANYQITPWLSAFGSYTFFRQRTDGPRAPGLLTADVDRNRIFVGLQVRYPIDLY